MSVAATPVSSTPKHPEVDEQGRIYATGRRKTSVARVWVKEGNGHFIVNDEPLASFFQPLQRIHVLEPFIVSDTAGMYDVWCTVKGGGISGECMYQLCLCILKHFVAILYCNPIT
ncbi:MAG: 30S ribosomal protein S9 [Sphingobacteriales bacterium]|nr:MAG: 30S ribosomal protein S9 [Sphingobacteriales bacterium]